MRIGIDFGGVIVRLDESSSIDPEEGLKISQDQVFDAFKKFSAKYS